MTHIELPKVTLKLLPGIGLGLQIYTKVELKGDLPLVKSLHLLVEVNITGTARLVEDESGAPKLVVENCNTKLGQIKILSGPLLLNVGDLLSNLLNNLIPGLLCPVIDLVLNILNTLLSTINGVIPLGTLGSLHYTLANAPLIRGEQLELDLNVLFTDSEGKTIKLPPVDLSSQLPLDGQTSQVVYSGQIVSVLLKSLASKGELNAHITGDKLIRSVPLTASALQSVLPQVAKLLPGNLPLEVKVDIKDVSDVSMENGRVSLVFTGTIDVLARTSSGLVPLFTLDMDLHLVGNGNIVRSKFDIKFSLKSLSLRIDSSEIGEFDAGALESWLKKLLHAGYLPTINDALDEGVPLRKVFNLEYVEGTAETTENGFVAQLAS